MFGDIWTNVNKPQKVRLNSPEGGRGVDRECGAKQKQTTPFRMENRLVAAQGGGRGGGGDGELGGV